MTTKGAFHTDLDSTSAEASGSVGCVEGVIDSDGSNEAASNRTTDSDAALRSHPPGIAGTAILTACD